MTNQTRERDLLNWIVACAERYGWLVKHVPAPMVADRKGGMRFVGSRRAAGLPDLFMLHADPPRLIIAEVKGWRGKLSKAQQEFLRMARDVADNSLMWLNDDDKNSWLERFGQKSIGVYVFEPGMEEAIEQLLRTRVLT